VHDIFMRLLQVAYWHYNIWASLLVVCLFLFRDYNKAVYGKRTLHQETYYQPRGTYKSHQGAPTPYDMSCAIDRRISSRLRRGTDGIVL